MTKHSPVLEAYPASPELADPASNGFHDEFACCGTEPIRLNIGGGVPVEGRPRVDGDDPEPLPGYINVDRRLGTGEAHNLSKYADNSVEEIYASHVLEHVPWRQREAVLREWFRVLKPGGRVRVAVPDMKMLAKLYLDGRYDMPLEAIWYGSQCYPDNFHQSGYDQDSLTYFLDAAGFVGIDRFASFHKDCSSIPWSLNLEAYKPKAEKCTAKIIACMSAPRLLFFDQVDSVEKVIKPMGIPVRLHTGSNWGQRLELCFQEAVDNGYDWILAMDYDTVFTEPQFLRLLTLFDAYSDQFDALAPLQIKRGGNAALFWRGGKPMGITDICPAIFSADSAHFGCTLIKTEILKKMPHPWFHHVPAPDGTWGDGREDDDIGFWRKLREAGGRLGVTSRMCVGHLQLMVSWLGADYQPIHQHVQEYRDHGPPIGVGHAENAGLVGAKGGG